MVEQLWKRGRTLGKGAYGVVSLAKTSMINNQPIVLFGVQLPSLIAIKSCTFACSRSLQRETEFLRMFQESSYVIHCFGVYITDENHVILYNLLLEYASGGSLHDRLHNNNSGEGLTEFEVKKHTMNVLLGLCDVHNKGIIHCDIKPCNILVTDGEIAKIADFGLAMTFEQSRSGEHGIRGTKRYMAPESVINHEYGPEIDIWALGCTVYELLTGTPLWESSEADLLYRIGFNKPKYKNPKLSNEAQDFLKMCLAKNPKSRWTAEMLLNHPFLSSSNVSGNVQPAKIIKKKSGYMSRLIRPHRKMIHL